MSGEAKIQNKKQVTFEMFRGGMLTSWVELCQQAASFASELGPERLITISHSEDRNEGIVVVWYWADTGTEAATPL
jgi:hypothetical protein